jgi:tripartite-type tricarboxylate transporter receptor subunit TctC
LVVVAPTGTPADVVARLNQEIGRFPQKPDNQQRLLALGLAVTGADTPETTEEFIRQQQAQWRSVGQELNLQPE